MLGQGHGSQRWLSFVTCSIVLSCVALSHGAIGHHRPPTGNISQCIEALQVLQSCSGLSISSPPKRLVSELKTKGSNMIHNMIKFGHLEVLWKTQPTAEQSICSHFRTTSPHGAPRLASWPRIDTDIRQHPLATWSPRWIWGVGNVVPIVRGAPNLMSMVQKFQKVANLCRSGRNHILLPASIVNSSIGANKWMSAYCMCA